MLARRIVSTAFITIGTLWLLGIALYILVFLALPGPMFLLGLASVVGDPAATLTHLSMPIFLIAGGAFLRRNLRAAV